MMRRPEGLYMGDEDLNITSLYRLDKVDLVTPALMLAHV